MAPPRQEQDFPPGHPARFDHNPDSPDAMEWRRQNVHLKGERDFPVDHPKAVDTEGNTNQMQWEAGVDPLNPELQAFTGRDKATADHIRQLEVEAAKQARESLLPAPTIAPPPPPPGDTSLPSGQPHSALATITGEIARRKVG